MGGEELAIRQVCPDCGQVDPDVGWHGEGESLEVGYLGPAVDGQVLMQSGRAVDVHIPCADCLGRRGEG